MEAGSQVGGSWPHYYDSLTLFSPARYSSLPGLAFAGDPDLYPRRDEVVSYLRNYAAALNADIRTNSTVDQIDSRCGEFTVSTAAGDEYRSPVVIAATGGFGKPHIPVLPGHDAFTGNALHASDYQEPSSFVDQRVVVVGAGNSAVQIATELAEVADVSIASRGPVRFVPQRPLGRDMHFWFAVSGLDTAPIGAWLRRHPTAPVFDHGHYRAAMQPGRPDRRPMFTDLRGDTVVWPDGTRERVNTLVYATGYQPALDYLAGIGALDPDGAPRHRRGLSTTHEGLGYVGLEWQRSLSSASLRGVGRDALFVVENLLGHKLSRRSVSA